MSLPAPKPIPAAEIIRNFGHWQREAQAGPLEITRHGRGRAVMMSVQAYDELAADADIRTDGRVAKLAQRQLSAILDNMDEGFIGLDAGLIVRSLNKVAATFHGVLRDDIVGLPIAALWPKRGELVVEHCRRVLRSGEVLHLDIVAAASERSASVRLFPYLDGVGLLFTNTTEQQRLREAAEDWTVFAAALAHNPAAGWLKLDSRGSVLEAGSDGLLSGHARHESGHLTLFDVVGPSDANRVQQAFEEAIVSRRPAELCIALAAPAGRRHDVHLSLRPLMRGSAPIGALAVFVKAHEPAGELTIA